MLADVTQVNKRPKCEDPAELRLRQSSHHGDSLSILVSIKVRFRDCHSVTLTECEVLPQIIRIKFQHLEKNEQRERRRATFLHMKPTK